ncbi:hypothetical protein HY373_01265, partial [Candidatus Berkelbacteria bacterium]|nr:hypothetical protein [Candidatus Berkelbacteria bacterium]
MMNKGGKDLKKREKIVLRWSVLLLILGFFFFLIASWWSNFELPKVKAGEVTQDTYLAPDDRNYDNQDIIVKNNATLTVDGEHTFKSLTINSGRVTHSPADREGKIKPYAARGDYWGLRFTGFLKIPKDKSRAVYIDSVDDGAKIEQEVLTGPTTGQIEQVCINWPGEANNCPAKNPAPGWLNKFKAVDSDKYALIKISFADASGKANLALKFSQKDYSTGQTSSVDLAFTELFYSQDSSQPGKMQVDFYVSKDDTQDKLFTLPNSGFTNAQNIATLRRSNGSQAIDLAEDFSNYFGLPPSGGSGFNFFWEDGKGKGEGKESNPYRPDKHKSNPLNNVTIERLGGRTLSSNPSEDLSVKKDIIDQWVRSSVWNPKLKHRDDSEDIEAGLNLTITNDLIIESGGKIDVTGKGYPGYGLDGVPWNGWLSALPGAGPGGGLSDAWGGNSAQAHGGAYGVSSNNGGFGGNACRPVDGQGITGFNNDDECGYGRGNGKRNELKYGSDADPRDLGSGGGASNDDAPILPSTGGSGGGRVIIEAKNINLNTSQAIAADGDMGWMRNQRGLGNSDGIWAMGASGSGGSINLMVRDTLSASGDGWNDYFMSAKGGANTTSGGSIHHSGGGGGRIKVAYTTNANFGGRRNDEFLTKLNVKGGIVNPADEIEIHNGTGGLSSLTQEDVILGSISKTPSDWSGSEIPVEQIFTYAISYRIPKPSISPYTIKDTLPLGLESVGPYAGNEDFDSPTLDGSVVTLSSNANASPGDEGSLTLKVKPNGLICGSLTNRLTLEDNSSPKQSLGSSHTITVKCISVTGSIHSGGNVTGIKVKGPALVTAGGGTITLDPSSEGDIQEITSYTLSSNYQTKMAKNIERLLNERAIEWPSNNTNLCQPLDTSCETHKEGGVFK